MEAVAKLKNVPTSPRKMRLVVDLIRGMDVNKALAVLKYESREGAERIEKLLLSAISNWENKYTDYSLEDADLYIKTVQVDGGKQVKRMRPAPQGRALRIRKRSNHVTLVIENKTDFESENQEIKQ